MFVCVFTCEHTHKCVSLYAYTRVLVQPQMFTGVIAGCACHRAHVEVSRKTEVLILAFQFVCDNLSNGFFSLCLQSSHGIQGSEMNTTKYDFAWILEI